MILRLASFNVLAVAYLNHGTYTPGAITLLRGPERVPRLVQTIENLGADIIGLQEVETSLVSALSATQKWHLLWTRKSGDKPDGCLLMVRRGIGMFKFDDMTFPDGTGHVMQSVEIGGVTIVNTHLKWSPEQSKRHFGVEQAQTVIGHLQNRPAVVMGDCNGRPGGRVRALFDENGFCNAWGDLPTALIVKDGVSERAPIDLIAGRGVKIVSAGMPPEVDGIPNRRCPSDHVPILADIHFG